MTDFPHMWKMVVKLQVVVQDCVGVMISTDEMSQRPVDLLLRFLNLVDCGIRERTWRRC